MLCGWEGNRRPGEKYTGISYVFYTQLHVHKTNSNYISKTTMTILVMLAIYSRQPPSFTYNGNLK